MKKLTEFVLLLTLVGCVTTSSIALLRILDRPESAKEHFISVDFSGMPDKKWCLSDEGYMQETLYIIRLNDTIDNYELLVRTHNGD